MNFEDWREQSGALNRRNDPGADAPFAEGVWNAAKKDVWATVFQIVSDRPDLASRAFIRMLEAARGDDGAGP